MKNKTQNMYGKITAILLTAVLLTAGLSCTALAAGENILASIQGFDPTFETGVGTATLTEAAAIIAGGHGGNGAHDANGKSISLPSAPESYQGANGKTKYKTTAVSIMAPVEPAKNYTFSFWMKNSVAGALMLQGGTGGSAFYAPAGYYYNGTQRSDPYLLYNVDTIGKDKSKVLDWKDNLYHTLIGVDLEGLNKNYVNPEDYTFGIAREGAAAEVWRQVSINFTTPPEFVSHVRLVLACAAADNALSVDDFSLVETSLEPNFVFNGNLEALRNDGDTSMPTGVAISGSGGEGTTEVITDSVKNNKFFKVVTTEELKYSRRPWQVDSKQALVMKGKSLGTRYKVSYKARAEVNKSQNMYASLQFSLDGNKPEYGFTASKTLIPENEWKNFTYYVDGTKLAAAGQGINGYTTQFVKYAGLGYTLYLDDFYAYYDKSNIGFYKTLEFETDTTENDRYFDFFDNNSNDKFKNDQNYKNIVIKESSIEAPSISELSANSDGSRTVKVRAHYLPEAKSWEPLTFDETKVTLLSSVYKYEKDTNGIERKTLVNVNIASGTSSVNGETIDVVGEVNVPKVVGGERYEVEAMALDMSDLKPIMDKQILK